MAAINDLINQIQDIALRERIQQEINKINKQKKFGLCYNIMYESVIKVMRKFEF